MSDQAVDVLVLGGGVIGVCSAYYLARAGRRVTLVDMGAVGSACSYGNAGLIDPSHCMPLAAPGVISKALRWMFNADSPFYIRPRWDKDLFHWLWLFRQYCTLAHVDAAAPQLYRLGMASLDLYRELAGLPGMDFALTQKGFLLLYATLGGLTQAAREAKLLQRYGVKVQMLDRPQVRGMLSCVSDQVCGGMFLPHDAHIIPDRFVRGLAQVLAAHMGVSVCPFTEVKALVPEAGRVRVVKTSMGDIKPNAVVLAGGSWSAELLRPLGVRLPLQPAKGYSVSIARPAHLPDFPLLLTEAKVCVTPMADRLRFAGTLELTGFDFSIRERRVAALLRAVKQYLVRVDTSERLETWAGLRPCTPDGVPIIGRAPGFENLIVATGHAMIGMRTGTGTGKLVAQMLTGEILFMDPAPFRLERFF